ncbi:hypothetical protein [Paenibacillus guangzhouensis]|uniref:hypothetical protein n=1 Tax=Paenibacillus guangzhouensis TaxID=1473112 RepID=UPI001266A63C|nr:hypothetical protein [Paenibacillus guangzhouensis]
MGSIHHKAVLDNYHFSGLEASQIGALLSALRYYNVPVTASWIYGMTGMAFLLVHDHDFKKPNAGPPEPQIFKLARNLGLEIEGIHTYAENESFRTLQQEMWQHAQTAIHKGYPVFAKNLDIRNQTSLVYGVDAEGYYTHSWHCGEGHENWDDVIPWHRLGQAYCPCRYCLTRRETSGYIEEERGLISLHAAKFIQPAEPLAALRDALHFVLSLNQQGVLHWQHHTYYIGEQAYEGWIQALERDEITKYEFSLTIEPLADARKHAVSFISEWRDLGLGLSSELLDAAVEKYAKIAASYQRLVQKYPYEQPSEFMTATERLACVDILRSLLHDEKQALDILVLLYEQIQAR